MPSLIIDSLEIPTETFLEFDQSYNERSAVDFRRAADGSGVLRAAWTGKLSTTVAARGWAPGLDDIAPDSTHVISCAMPRAIKSETNIVTLPTTRRTDEDPIGFAVVNGFLIETPISNLTDINAENTNDATLTTVAGASSYRVHYFPLITAAIVTNSVSGSSTANYSWQFEAEEV